VRKRALLGAALLAASCGESPLPTKPIVVPPAKAVVAAPVPTATPAFAPNDVPAWEVSCSGGATMTVKYNGGAPYAQVLTYSTSFDGPAHTDDKVDTLKTGGGFDRGFDACRQSDAEPLSGPPAGHCYFDINGRPFSDPHSPKVTECRNRCTPYWSTIETVRVIQDWTDFVSTQCSKSQRRLVVKQEQNSCTKEVRDKGEPYYEIREVATTCPTDDPPGICYYNVPGDDGKNRCLAQPGFLSWNAQNHLCGLSFPGVSSKHFELNPGQSAAGCLSKHD